MVQFMNGGIVEHRYYNCHYIYLKKIIEKLEKNFYSSTWMLAMQTSMITKGCSMLFF